MVSRTPVDAIVLLHVSTNACSGRQSAFSRQIALYRSLSALVISSFLQYLGTLSMAAVIRNILRSSTVMRAIASRGQSCTAETQPFVGPSLLIGACLCFDSLP